MSNNEAKFLLTACRPGGQDATDPAFASALEQAKADPALASWFQREQAHAAAVAGKLREIAPPAGLREAILAGARASSPPAARGPRTRWWLGAVTALAAAIAAVVVLWPSREVRADTLTAFAIDDVIHGKHGGHGAAESALQVALSNPANRLSAHLPIDFGVLKSTGCRTLSVAGHDVLEVCFMREGTEYHCYIARVGEGPATKRDEVGSIVREGQLVAAAVSRGAYRFVVVSGGEVEALKRLL